MCTVMLWFILSSWYYVDYSNGQPIFGRDVSLFKSLCTTLDIAQFQALTEHNTAWAMGIIICMFCTYHTISLCLLCIFYIWINIGLHCAIYRRWFMNIYGLEVYSWLCKNLHRSEITACTLWLYFQPSIVLFACIANFSQGYSTFYLPVDW